MNKQKHFSNQRGFVAIFSVIFFALLAMVITVGFIRITVYEQQQALDNDLTARALAAAEAGAEDAKRVLAYYQQLPDSQKENFRTNIFGSDQDCDALYGNARLQSELGLESDGRVAPNQNLYYTCLNVSFNTDDFADDLAKGESTVIPLRSVDDRQFNTVNLQWHLVSDSDGAEGDGQINGFFPDKDLPTTNGDNGFSSLRTPAYLRVQMIAAPKNNVSRGDLYERSRTVFLQPSSNPNSLGRVGMRAGDPRGTPPRPGEALGEVKDSPVMTECERADSGQYACQIKLGIPIGRYPVDQNKYFLRITSLYRGTHVRAQIERCQGGDCSPRTFEGVQPRIDSTGRAADAFRRIVTRVDLGNNREMLNFGVQTAGDICKQFQVATKPSHYSSACDPAPGE